MEDFLLESQAHGWLSFRDEEVEWSNIHILPDGEAVSVAGTHLGRKWHAYLLKFLSRSDAIIYISSYLIIVSNFRCGVRAQSSRLERK